ncbi:MAG: MFS transporter [Proteobacteria bacterium]|nr:MFS transporter [Pseudomonadota bacterium]
MEHEGRFCFGRLYYGWVIVGVSLLSMAFWVGIRSTFSVFYVALLEEFPWSRGETAGIQSTVFLTYMIMAPVVGGLIDRFGPRRIIAPGILLLALGLILSAYVNSLFQFYFFYGILMGTGITCIAIVSYTSILAYWFEKKRGVASGIAVSGMGLGTFLLVPLSQHFISLWGWRPALLVLGALVLIILFPLNALLLRHKPQEMGLSPDGLTVGESLRGISPKARDDEWLETDWTLERALRTGRFWSLLAFAFLLITPVYIVLVHHVSFLVDHGIERMDAALAFAAVGIVSSAFRIFWGWLSDRVGRETTSTLGAICVSLGTASLILIERISVGAFVYPFVIFFGAGWGVTAPMFMAVAGDLFRGRGFGLIYGILEAVVGVGSAVGAWMAGFIFDRTASYELAFILALSASIISCLFVWFAAPRKVGMARR